MEGSGCLSVRQEHWLRTWMVLGGDPSMVPLSAVATDNGYSGRVADHVMQKAGCLMVVQDGNLNDLGHIPQDWALWGPGDAEQAQTYTIPWFHLTACKRLRHSGVTASGPAWTFFWGIEKHGGERIRVSLWQHRKRKSPFGLIASDVWKMKCITSV